jgi:hypothetical protein
MPTCIGLWNFDVSEYRTRETTIYGLYNYFRSGSRHLVFLVSVGSEVVGEGSDGLVDAENVCVGFEISTLSSFLRELRHTINSSPCPVP